MSSALGQHIQRDLEKIQEFWLPVVLFGEKKITKRRHMSLAQTGNALMLERIHEGGQG